MVRATLVELEDGLAPSRSRARAGSSRARRAALRRVPCALRPARRRRRRAPGSRRPRQASGRDDPRPLGARLPARLEGDLRVLTRTTAVGLYDGNYVLAVERGRRLWQIRAKRVVLATGAIERPLVFANTTGRG